MKPHFTQLALGLMLLSSPFVHSQTPPSDDITEWHPVVVSANRMPQTVDETLAAVTVITSEDLELTQPRSVVEALRGVPGISIARNGGLGKVSSVFLRGSESDQVLVLVDGLRVGSSSTGAFAWQDLPISQVERIEIVRGPRSSLYGSEAVGGVIQIFTKRGEGPPALEASVGVGNHQSREGSLAVSGSRNGFNARLGVHGLDTQGENSCRIEAGTQFGGCFTSEPDEDGYRNLGGQLALGYQVSPGNRIELNGLYTETENEFDGSFQNKSEGQQNQVGVAIDLLPLDIWSTRLTAGRSEDKIDSTLNDVFASRYQTRKDSVSWLNNLSLNDAMLFSLGADYLNEELESSDNFSVTSRETLGGFGQMIWSLERLRIELTGRHDNVEGQPSQWTGSAAAGLQLTDTTRLHTSIGNAYKTPSFNELYFPGFGNPNLEPEKSRSTELGVHHQQGNWRATATAYQSWVEQLIAFDSVTFAPVNIDQARIKGFEATVEYRSESWLGGADFDWLRAYNETGVNAGNELPRRPDRKFRVHLTRIMEKWSLGGDILFVARTWDNLANTREIGAWQRVDLHAAYALVPGVDLKARVENLFDTEYETAAFYNEPGLTYWVSLSLDTSTL